MPLSMRQTVNWQRTRQTLGRVVMVPAIATASWGLPAIVAPQSTPLAAQSTDLCRLTKTTTTRFETNSLGSPSRGTIPAEIPVILVSPPSGGGPLVEVKYPRQYGGFVPLEALGPCSPGVPPGSVVTPSVCRRVIAKVEPSLDYINLRAKPQGTIVGKVYKGASVFVMTKGGAVQAVNSGGYSWIQIDLKQTRTLANGELFSIDSGPDPAEVWMFNTDVNKPGLGNLGMCLP